MPAGTQPALSPALAGHRPGHRPARDLPLRRPPHRRRRHARCSASTARPGDVLWRVDDASAHQRRHARAASRASRPDGAPRRPRLRHRRGHAAHLARPARRRPRAGAVVHLPGLPRLVIVTEGEHHLVAIDLTSGEPRWRWAWGGRAQPARGAPRRAAHEARRQAPLLHVRRQRPHRARRHDRRRRLARARPPPLPRRPRRSTTTPSSPSRAGRSSAARFTRSTRSPGTCAGRRTLRRSDGRAVHRRGGRRSSPAGVVAVPVRDARGSRLVAHDRETGRARAGSPRRASLPRGRRGSRWTTSSSATPRRASSSPSTRRPGELRWRHVLGRAPSSPTSPAGSSPSSAAARSSSRTPTSRVLRPRDGALLGRIAPSEAIPDLLRVDERCDVYVAEESGHLVSFARWRRLSLVR